MLSTMLRPMDDKEYLLYIRPTSCRKQMVFSLRSASLILLRINVFSAASAVHFLCCTAVLSGGSGKVPGDHIRRSCH